MSRKMTPPTVTAKTCVNFQILSSQLHSYLTALPKCFFVIEKRICVPIVLALKRILKTSFNEIHLTYLLLC